MKRNALLVCVALILCACHPSADDVGGEIKTLLQEKLKEGDLAPYGLTVSKVDVIHEDSNRYQGVATVLMNGRPHQVSLNIVADGDKVMYTTDQGAFLFVVQDAIAKLTAPPTQQPAADAGPASVQSLMNLEEAMNDKCRGGSGDSPDTAAACADRDATITQIKENGWCWGHKDDIGADRKWVQCVAGD